MRLTAINRRLAEVFRKRDNGFEAAAAQIRNLFKRLFDYAITCQIVSLNPAHATPDALYHSRLFSHPGTIAR
jgi:hypothetical protein